MRVLLVILMSVTVFTSCGPEREYSGVWQQVCDAENACEDNDGLLFELHLGRYGDGLTGLIVRYRDQGEELDTFRKSNDCGCFVIENGRAGQRLKFQLDRPNTPGFPDQEGSRHNSCRVPPASICESPTFTLASDDEFLVGTVTCGASTYDIRFLAVKDRARTRCFLPER